MPIPEHPQKRERERPRPQVEVRVEKTGEGLGWGYRVLIRVLVTLLLWALAFWCGSRGYSILSVLNFNNSYLSGVIYLAVGFALLYAGWKIL